ncbi:MAG: TonB-dependent receptor [Polyangiaceae bacterium]
MLRRFSRPSVPPFVVALCGAVGTLLAPGETFAHDVVPPVPTFEAVPLWPNGHVEAHDVVVPVIVVVGPDGRVTEASIETSVSAEFDAAALVAARAFTYVAATQDGLPVAAKVRAVVRFKAEAGHVHSASPPARAEVPAPPSAPAEAEVVQVRGPAPPRSASEVRRGQDVIGAAPHRTASDTLNVVPGIFVTQHSGEGKAHQIFLRGFDAVHGQDLEISVGGIPVNEVSNIHGQGYADLHFVMPEVIKELQAQPGTYDPRQGDFAIAGSIRMKLGYKEPGFSTKGTLGSFGTKRLFLAFHPKDSSDETFAAFESYSTDGFGPNRAAQRGSFIGQAVHDFGGGVGVRALLSAYTGHFDSPGVLKESDITGGRVDRFATYDPKQGGDSSRTQLLVELHKDGEHDRLSIAPFVVLRSLALRQNFTGFFADTQKGGAPSLESDNTQQLHKAVMVGATASYRRGTKVFSERDSIEVGLYGRSDWITQSQRRLSDVDDRPTATLVDASVRGTNVAGYVDATLNPLPRLALRGGLRADVLAYATEDLVPAAGTTVSQERSAMGAHLGKKITADAAVVPELHALLSYGEGFRSPQARSLSNGERTPFAEAHSVEGGLRYATGQAFAGSLAVFHTRLDKDLVFDQATARNEAVPSTARSGAALELTARPTSWLTMSGSVTYTRAVFTGSDATYKEGDLLPYVPQWVARTDIVARKTLTQVWGRPLTMRVGYGLESLVRRPLPFSEFGHDVFLVDTSMGLRLREVELGLDVTNLLGADWYDGQFVYASNFGRQKAPNLVPFRHVTVGAPRSLFVTLALYL